MRRFLVLILFFITLTFLVYPHAFLSPQNTLPDNNDTRLIAYIIGQVQKNLIYRQPLYWGTFFAPYENTLTYSEPFLTSALLTMPFRHFTVSPITIFNIAFIINFFLTLLASFLLFRYLFDDDWLAVFLVVLLNLSGFHLIYLPHIQVFSLWPLLLSLYLFLRYQKEGHYLCLTLFFLTFSAQIMESLFNAYLIFFACLIVFLFYRRSLNKIIRLSLFFVPLWLIFLFPYLKMHFSFPEATRPIRDAANFSLGLEEVFTTYRSLVFAVIFISSLIIGKSLTRIKPFIAIFVFSLIMSFGPVIKIFGHTLKIFHLPIPLPYALFYYLFPGFTGFRTPSRFIVLAAISATIIIGFHLLPIFKKLLPQTKFFLSVFLMLLLFLEFPLPYPSYPVDITLPPVYLAVKKLPESAIILELPIKLWTGPDHEIESVRSLYSLEHGHRRVNGYSGFSPLAWIDLVNKINANGLDYSNLNLLHSLGVTHVVENNRLYPLP